MNIARLDINTAKNALPDLINLMIDSIEDGASIGFLLPLQTEEVHTYWQKRLDVIAEGNCVLVAAYVDGVLAGSAQLALEPRANGSHRAEVQKVMVHTAYRRRGIARQLMEALEAAACEHQRSLLVLDTRERDASNDLYLALDYVHAGTIPQYCRNNDGTLAATVLYYKILG
jgi:acetyltransferase